MNGMEAAGVFAKLPGGKKIRLVRAIMALLLAFLGGVAGYTAHGEPALTPDIPAQVIEAPAQGTTRILYSLDAKQNDEELIALINEAESSIYFAIYTFTLDNVADALIAAKRRGVAVYGVIDSSQASSAYGAPISKKLQDAGIPVVSERHPTGNGIMHIKALVTEQAYAVGSYNWTNSGTTINDEVLELGTDPRLRQAYENILKRLYEAYRNNPAPTSVGAVSVLQGTYDYTDAGKHVGEYAAVRGMLKRVYTSKTGTMFLDFCENYKTCPFSGVIFADDAEQFDALNTYVGQIVTLTGKIQLYEGRAEIILSDPSQLQRD